MTGKIYDKINARNVYMYTIADGGLEVDICDCGARINAIRFNGVDVALGFNSVEDYEKSGTYAGATIGRVANRIAGGRFILNGRPYFLNQNNGENHLHGGNLGFDKKFFEVLKCSESCVTMQYISADGEERYPGTLRFKVTFTVENAALKIEFSAESDKDTLWCPTNHTYFNLDGEGSGDCLSNLLKLNAAYYTPVDAGLIPTGEKAAVNGTAFDFGEMKEIGRDYGKSELQATGGYDHNYILNGEYAAHAESNKTGIKMDLYTNLPCVQLYTGGSMGKCKGKNGYYDRWGGFCLEPQFCPNAINTDGFEKPVLKKGENAAFYMKLQFSM